MGRLRIVKGKIFEVVENDLHYYSETAITESASYVYAENGDDGISHVGKPEKAPSADLVNYYIKVRIYNPPVIDPANPPKKYNGEFGFDWIDVDPSSEEVQKIQDVDFSNVEYFYKKGATANDLGDIIAKSTDEQGAKDAITANYRLSECPKPCKDGKIDMPFVLMKPGQEISLSLEVALTSGVLNNEKIYLEGNDCYSFELVGGTKTGNKTEKIIADKEIIVLKIKCLKESPETTFKIKQENPIQKLETVGGFTMMENKVLKLKFRVIALVANEPGASAKAQALFQKFKDNKVKEYLNENSLNQAGYEVEIENQAMFDTLGSGDLDDYFYAFDKTDWTTKNLFTANHIKTEKKIKISFDASGNPIKTETTINKTVDVISYEGNIDGITADEYRKKLAIKLKTYNGGLIILADFEAKPDHVGAFSQTFPLDHNMLFVYSSNSNGQTYAHEIGHMLGLAHTFITINPSTNTDNTKDYRDKKKQINDLKIDSIESTKSKIENEKRANQGKPLGKQSKFISTFTEGYNGIKKETLLDCIDNSNGYFEARIRDYNVQINTVNNNTNYTMPKKDGDGKWILNPNGTIKQFPTTPTLFKERLKEQKKDFEKYKENNISTKSKLQTISSGKYVNFNKEFNLISEDELKIYEDYLGKLMKEWQQIASNYIYFKQNNTKNIMDYTPSEYDVKAGKSIEQCIRFLNHQILIMRKDYENY